MWLPKARPPLQHEPTQTAAKNENPTHPSKTLEKTIMSSTHSSTNTSDINSAAPSFPDPNTLAVEDVIERLQQALERKGWTPWQFSSGDYNYETAIEYMDFIGEFLHSLGGTQWKLDLRDINGEDVDYFDTVSVMLIASRYLPTDDVNYTIKESHQMIMPLDEREGDEAEAQIRSFAIDVITMLKRAHASSAPPNEEDK